MRLDPNDHDRWFKQLLQTFFLEFLELFLPKLRAELDTSSVTFLDKEIFTDVMAGERHEVDLVAQAKLRGHLSCFLFHVENQAQPQSKFNERMFVYFSRLFEKYHLPVYPIVIFSFDKPSRPEPNAFQMTFPDWKVLEFKFRVIQLNRLRWRDFLQRENPVAVALMAKMKIASQDRSRVKFECLRLLATLKLDRARMHLIAGFVDNYLKLTAQEKAWLDHQVEVLEPVERKRVMAVRKSWFEEAQEEGLQQGLQRGLQQGHEAGLKEGVLMVVRMQLEQRLGKLSQRLEKRINQLSLKQLQKLSGALLGFMTRSDLIAWLDKHAAK